MKPFITRKKLPAHASVRMARATTVLAFLIFTLLALTMQAQAQEAPRVNTFPNAPGWITVLWEHSGDGVYSFVVERQGSPYNQGAIVAVAVLNSPTRQFTDMNLQAATSYNHRVCAVYDNHRTCSEWVRNSTLPPPTSGRSGESKPPPPPPLSTPALRARAGGPKIIVLEWSYSSADRLTSMTLYRDGQFLIDGDKGTEATGMGVFTTIQADTVPRFNTEYTYKLCFSNPDEKHKCSDPVTMMADPWPPTAPADVKVAAMQASGGRALGGAVRLRPRATINMSWRNTDVPGQFITVEALDTSIPGDSISGGAMRTAPRQRWIEATRVSARDNPTSLTIDRPRSLISADGGLSTYRVCAVVPTMGAAGKVCSQPVSLP